MNKYPLTEILFAEKYFTTPKYAFKVKEAKRYFLHERYEEVENILKQLPTKESLMKDLIEKLNGKPVYKNIKKLLKGENVNKYTTLIGLSSLLTHAAISCKQGDKEYEVLFPILIDKISEVMYCSKVPNIVRQ